MVLPVFYLVIMDFTQQQLQLLQEVVYNVVTQTVRIAPLKIHVNNVSQTIIC